jgi:hypothetical protein
MDWNKEIGIAFLVKRKVAEADINQIWEHSFPAVAATELEISDVEARLGYRLDDGHRDFLLRANGWDWYFQSVDILGTADFLEGARYDKATDLLNSLESLKELCGFNREELLPVAVSRYDADVFAITTSNSDAPGKVFWFAGQLIDTFPDFGEWFLSMVDYNRNEYSCLIQGVQAST